MSFHVKFFGSRDPDASPGAPPLGEWTWDKLPMGREPYIDWSSGTIRSPLFRQSDPDPGVRQPEPLSPPDFDQPPADWPQWRVWISGADGNIRCDGGDVWIFVPSLASSGADEAPALAVDSSRHAVPAADLGSGAGLVAWRWRPDGPDGGELVFPAGSTPSGACDVQIAVVSRTSDGLPSIRQLQASAIFFLPPVTPDGGGDGGGGPDPSLPPCGHPGNGGSGDDGGPGDGDGYDGAHPGDSHGSGASGSHPGDAEGDDGATPSSGGCDDEGGD